MAAVQLTRVVCSHIRMVHEQASVMPVSYVRCHSFGWRAVRNPDWCLPMDRYPRVLQVRCKALVRGNTSRTTGLTAGLALFGSWSVGSDKRSCISGASQGWRI